MESFKFAKVDFQMSKGQLKLMYLFLIIGAFMGYKADSPVFMISYVAFGAMVIASTPFFYEMTSQKGFYSLLPAKAQSRAIGRMLFGVLYTAIWVLISAPIMIIITLFTHKSVDYFAEMVIVILSIAIFGEALQTLILSLVKVKNAQVMSIIRMIIPFALFFGGSFFMEKVEEGKDMEFLERMVAYILGHTMEAASILLAVVLLFTIICTVIVSIHAIRQES